MLATFGSYLEFRAEAAGPDHPVSTFVELLKSDLPHLEQLGVVEIFRHMCRTDLEYAPHELLIRGENEWAVVSDWWSDYVDQDSTLNRINRSLEFGRDSIETTEERNAGKLVRAGHAERRAEAWLAAGDKEMECNALTEAEDLRRPGTAVVNGHSYDVETARQKIAEMEVEQVQTIRRMEFIKARMDQALEELNKGE
jgi:hypothetical protein